MRRRQRWGGFGRLLPTALGEYAVEIFGARGAGLCFGVSQQENLLQAAGACYQVIPV
jgi:hypothetical protein